MNCSCQGVKSKPAKKRALDQKSEEIGYEKHLVQQNTHLQNTSFQESFKTPTACQYPRPVPQEGASQKRNLLYETKAKR